VPSSEQAAPSASGALAAAAPFMAIPPAVAKAPTRIPWAELLERVFRIDVLNCERCGGRMTVLAFLTERASVKKVLEHLGLPTTGPPIAKARDPVESPVCARGPGGLRPRAYFATAVGSPPRFRITHTGVCFSQTKARGYTKGDGS